MDRDMNTTKGTHIDFPIKRRIRLAAAFVSITIYLLACVCTSQQILAQETDTIQGGINMGARSIDHDQAITWFPRGRTWVISGIQRSFGLKELDEPWVHVGASRSHYSVALGAKTLGWDHMRQWILASSARYEHNDLSIVFGSDYWLLRLRHPYRNDRAVTFRTEVSKSVHEEIVATVWIQNILGSKWQIGGDPIERSLQLELSSIVHRNVLFSAGFGVGDQFPADYQSDILWSPNDGLIFKFGVGSMPSRFQMGIRIDNGGWMAGSGFAKITNSSIGWRQNYWLGRVTS